MLGLHQAWYHRAGAGSRFGRGVGVGVGLEGEQFVVPTPGRHEFAVGAAFDDPALVQNMDAVGHAYRRHAVGDEHDGGSGALSIDKSHHRFYWGTELMLVCGKGFAGTDFAADMAELGITAVLPARRDEEDPGAFPARLRQRTESVNWTLKGQLGLEDHGGHVLSGCGPGCYSSS